eukprot:6470893-Lingulodinium_polyedra.AAC.1
MTQWYTKEICNTIERAIRRDSMASESISHGETSVRLLNIVIPQPRLCSSAPRGRTSHPAAPAIGVVCITFLVGQEEFVIGVG